PGKSAEEAEEDGFEVLSVADAVKQADDEMVLLPDQLEPTGDEESIKPKLKGSAALAYGQGMQVHFQQVARTKRVELVRAAPKGLDVFLAAPKGPGHLVRRTFEEGAGVPALYGIYQDYTGKAKDIALAYTQGIGAARAGVIETSFQEETETDLFGEQAVLCGGTTALVKAGFETLTEAGYQPEVAYFECLHELKLIVDLLYEGGLENMRYSISDTAQWGDFVSGPRVINDETKARMKEV